MSVGTSGQSSRSKDLNAGVLMQAGVHPAMTGLTGRGIVCCIVDYGFDILHPSLRQHDGSTRFACLIDQNAGVLEQAAIDRLIRDSERAGRRAPADAVYDPHQHYFGRDGVVVGAHGTWVASIAAGTRSQTFCGVAPEAKLIGVQLALPDEVWRETTIEDVLTDARASGTGARRWRSYDEAGAIIEAVEAGVAAARALDPAGIVLNLSIGAWAGSHHPGAAVNKALSRLSACGDGAADPPLFIIVGTGNAGCDNGHSSAVLAPGEGIRLGWHLETGRASAEKLEVWADQPIDVLVDVAGATGRAGSLRISGDDGGLQRLVVGDRVVAVAEGEQGCRGALGCVRVLVAPGRLFEADGRCSTVELAVSVRAPQSNRQPGEVHAWIERNSAGAGSRLVPAAQSGTLTSLATAPGVIAVAGLETGEGGGVGVLAMSGRGPAPWAGQRPRDAVSPTLAAPASGILGARSKTTGFMRGSGTSAAAAIVSGASAQAIEAANRAGQRLSRSRLVAALTGERGACWSRDLGWGPLSFVAPGRMMRAPPGCGTSRPAGRAIYPTTPQVEGNQAP